MATRIKKPETLLRRAAAAFAADPTPCGGALLRKNKRDGSVHCCAVGSVYLAAGVPESAMDGRASLSWGAHPPQVANVAVHYLNRAANELYGTFVENVNDKSRTYADRHRRIARVFERAIELAK